MRMQTLGNSGLFVSELCFGAMTFGGTEGLWGQVGKLGQEEADALVAAALEAGINFFDTANVYADGRSEAMLGQSLRNLGVSRDDVVIATKAASAMGVGPNLRGGSRRHLLSQCRASLRRLGLEHIDLYQIHAFDPATPIEETLEALDTLVRAGDVRYVVGHSFGGLFVQMLLDRGLGAAGGAIDPGPPQGVLPGPTALWAALPVFFSPLSWQVQRWEEEQT